MIQVNTKTLHLYILYTQYIYIKETTMTHYTNILIASDLTLDTLRLIERAKMLAADTTKISIIHGIPPVGFNYGGISSYIPDMEYYEKVQKKVITDKKQHVQQMIESHKLENVEWDIEVGKPAEVVKNFADNHSCDLIIIGSHGEKGLRALLGTTATGVLHDAPCDVLSVRLFERSKT